MKTLALLPSQNVSVTSSGKVVLTRKFISGMARYVELWDGPVRAVLNTIPKAPAALDNIEVDPRDLPFQVVPTSYAANDFYSHLWDASVVLGGPHYQLHGWTRRLQANGVAAVACVEYTLQTRLNIASVEEPSKYRVAKRAAWEIGEEIRNLRDIRNATAVQCNGTPTYDTYQDANTNRHLYFDTRVSENDYATEGDMVARKVRCGAGKPLHLAFSGRWIRMKGAHHLTDIARELTCRKIPYQFSICGDGSLKEYLQGEILRHKLANVHLLGNLDFTTQLLPFLRSQVDLFVAPHVQGDPSCTYLETLACGVPIIGYANEAWAGILNRVDVGWATPVGNPKALARTIADLHVSQLAEKAQTALKFAQQHSFERTYAARIRHLESVAR